MTLIFQWPVEANPGKVQILIVIYVPLKENFP